MLLAKIDYLIHYSNDDPRFVTLYRPMLPWESWPDVEDPTLGNLISLSEHSLGSEYPKKFSEGTCIVVSSYTEATETARRLKNELGLEC